MAVRKEFEDLDNEFFDEEDELEEISEVLDDEI